MDVMIKIFDVSFIGDNTCANLKKKFIKKFNFELNNKTNIKKKDLLSAIDIACQLMTYNNNKNYLLFILNDNYIKVPT